MRREDGYQIALISLGIVATILFGIFFLREWFPEYKIYQTAYVALENFRSSYNSQPPAPFSIGIKQIVLEEPSGGPPKIDRCTTCHIALDIPDYSPTKIAKDPFGNPQIDEKGNYIHVANEDYVWTKVNEKIADLKSKGQDSEAARFENLFTADIDGNIYDMKKVLVAHPLMGRETRPFEFHPQDEYGCTVCHSGNGRSVTTERAHGPVFDGHYEAEFTGPHPEFLEKDPENDPLFSRVFNSKPGHGLLFQIHPTFPGGLIEASCVQCHTPESGTEANQKGSKAIFSTLDQEKKSLENAIQNDLVLLNWLASLYNYPSESLNSLHMQSDDFGLDPVKRQKALSAYSYFKVQQEKNELPSAIKAQTLALLGNWELGESLFQLKEEKREAFLKKEAANNPQGSLFKKWKRLATLKELSPYDPKAQNILSQYGTDPYLQHFIKGQELYITQACYACHRIAGVARGGVGPELTQEGLSYPWFVKESMVWPQADLKTSTMPNFRLDHVELENLMTYLLAQKGQKPAIGEIPYKKQIQAWESGSKKPLEEAVSADKIRDLKYGMTVFALEGCAACHRLKGYESDYGFEKEDEKEKRSWFLKAFPENIQGSEIVQRIEREALKIDKSIVLTRKGSLLNELEEKSPGLLMSFNSPFHYAERGKNRFFEDLLAHAKNEEERQQIQKNWDLYKERVQKILHIYVQEYGLGRLVGPRPNWSGVYRSDEWLMEHFRKPSSKVPRSIMPVFPFDDTKFYALTYMLDILGKRNRDAFRKLWENKGFNPEKAFQLLCAQCHGEGKQGNGPVAEWIYPIPKNLNNAEFLRNLTREQALISIVHGVQGTPMAPWGEAPKDKPDFDGVPVLTEAEAKRLVDWIFSTLPGEDILPGGQDLPKWQYKPGDIERELKKEGNLLESDSDPLSFLSETDLSYLASTEPLPTPQDTALFDVVRIPGTGQTGYFIKKKFYTKANLDKGREFFEMNCAVCHGKDADGAGNRAASMIDAKPRMLTNVDWNFSRDDLRLLGSIKYGVPGTSMTAWGDLTTSLLRLQLVMYIRSLTEESRKERTLAEALFQTFDSEETLLVKIQAPYEKTLSEVELKKEHLQEALQGTNKDVSSSYAELTQIQADNKQALAKTEIFSKLHASLQAEKKLWNTTGKSLLNTLKNDDAAFAAYIKLLEANQNRFSIKNDRLLMSETSDPSLFQPLFDKLHQEIEAIKQKKEQIHGELAGPSRIESEKEWETRLKSRQRLFEELHYLEKESLRRQEEQKHLVESINS